ncbi:MAG TPA: hypothetical protein VL503_08430 [Candidatus Omnitrophota bacterium]|nr:hypothetical protein [Candidatus Omnitrophota bacterium]
MKRNSHCLLAALSLALVAAPSAAAPRWRALERIAGHEPVAVTVEGAARGYYRLDRVAPLEIPVTGPARLQVITRAEIAPGREGVWYRVWGDLDGTRLREERTESAPARKASIAGAARVVCKSRTFSWEIPAGDHRLRIFGDVPPPARGGNGGAVLARLRMSLSETGPLPMVSLTPVDAIRSVTLAEGETLIPYYTIVPGKPARVRVVGPTDLELTSRLDFDTTMRGEQSYRVQVWEAGRRLRQFDWRTTKASTASYTDLHDRVASKMSRVTFPVGEGTHELLVHLIEPKQGSAEIRIRIPQPTAGASE